jgi:hypothetical protein
MGYFIRNKGDISDYSINFTEEATNFSVIHLLIETDRGSITYRICSDSRQPDLNRIYSDLDSALTYVMNNENAEFEINEYLERNYIFVTYPDGKTLQYTASIL